jgi:hypothetical protein
MLLLQMLLVMVLLKVSGIPSGAKHIILPALFLCDHEQIHNMVWLSIEDKRTAREAARFEPFVGGGGADGMAKRSAKAGRKHHCFSTQTLRHNFGTTDEARSDRPAARPPPPTTPHTTHTHTPHTATEKALSPLLAEFFGEAAQQAVILAIRSRRGIVLLSAGRSYDVSLRVRFASVVNKC